MGKIKRIKIYSSNGKKLVTLAPEEIEAIQQDTRYEKIHEHQFNKAKHTYEVKHYYSTLFWKDLVRVILSALITTLAMDFFISATGNAGLFPGGIGAFARLLSIIIGQNLNFSASTLYFLFYFAMNIPLAIFGYFKISGRFSVLTIIYMLFTIAFDLIIQNTPYINPQELSMLIDFNLASQVSSIGSIVVWLFIFAVFGGMINGFSYSLIYKANGSTGGADWISYYYSRKHNKSIAMLNVRINIVILAIVIVLNTIIMDISNIEASFKMNQIYYQFDSWEAYSTSEFRKNVFNVLVDNPRLWLSMPTLGPDSFDANWLEYCKAIATNAKFDGCYTQSMLVALKCKFIFGPSLFASLILIIAQGLTVDKFYPKNKVLNLMISTSKVNDVQQYLYNVGYNNNVFVWQTRTSKKNAFSDQEQDLIMISMPMIYWKKIEQHIMKIDEEMIINIIGSKIVKGKNFSYTFDNETRDKVLTEEFLANAKLMKKIDSDAIIKTHRKMKKSSVNI